MGIRSVLISGSRYDIGLDERESGNLNFKTFLGNSLSNDCAGRSSTNDYCIKQVRAIHLKLTVPYLWYLFAITHTERSSRRDNAWQKLVLVSQLALVNHIRY